MTRRRNGGKCGVGGGGHVWGYEGRPGQRSEEEGNGSVDEIGTSS
jgi:hypothetical protein